MTTRMGWHSRGYIPHFDCYGAVQHVIFRSSNTLPRAIIEECSKMHASAARRRIDAYLDTSKNGDIFADCTAAMIVEETLLHFAGSRFDLLAWCIMPNHIHALVIVLGEYRLGDIVRTWKMQATKRLGQGQIFAADYFDRFIRNSKQMATTIAYIEENPVQAGLCRYPSEWRWSSAAKKATGWLPKLDNCPLYLS